MHPIMNLRIVCLSDTHGLHDRIEVPEGDLLLHTGDRVYGMGAANNVR